jgi:alpha-1,3-glucan synthase
MNSSTPFDLDGYPLLYKYHDLIYADFQLNNTIDPQCQLPELLDEFGNTANATLLHGCYDSDFNQFGDIEAFGVYPIWQRRILF